jgi:streptomycin 6-kinase
VATIPDRVVRALLARRGPQARAWIEGLPALLDEYACRWSLTPGEPFSAISYNYVAPATRRDGTPAVLKISMPEDPDFGMEAEALRRFDGRGSVRLLALERTETATIMLLERLDPGVPLSAVADDAQAISAAVAVMRALWRPIANPHSFPTIARWGIGLEQHRLRYGGSGPIPGALFERAVALYRDLGASMASPVLLHGDLHQDNILAAERAPWLAIDPKGVVGEPACELYSLLRNPWERLRDLSDLKPLFARRIAQLAGELGFERERIRDWGLAQAVLSTCWRLEGGTAADVNHAAFPIACAEALSRVTV